MSTPQNGCSLCYLCAKNFHNRSKFDKVLTKNKFAQFFESRCTNPNISLNVAGDNNAVLSY